MNNHNDGIDIYLYSDFCGVNLGQANGVGNSGELLLAGMANGQSMTTSHAISHEMGHVLFLWHTHHGTSGGCENHGDANACTEYADISNYPEYENNPYECGDYC